MYSSEIFFKANHPHIVSVEGDHVKGHSSTVLHITGAINHAVTELMRAEWETGCYRSNQLNEEFLVNATNNFCVLASRMSLGYIFGDECGEYNPIDNSCAMLRLAECHEWRKSYHFVAIMSDRYYWYAFSPANFKQSSEAGRMRHKTIFIGTSLEKCLESIISVEGGISPGVDCIQESILDLSENYDERMQNFSNFNGECPILVPKVMGGRKNDGSPYYAVERIFPGHNIDRDTNMYLLS